MLVSGDRPRNLSWLHAGPMLYGDWGTSRLYVLGLAFFFTGHGSVLFLAAIGVLMVAVAWAYTHICRCYPEGGGVYTAAKEIHPLLAIVGSTLLLAGYIMTAAISVVEAFHYFGAPRSWVLVASILSLVLLGAVNWMGAKSAGRFALIIAIAALAISGLIGLFSLAYVPEGIRTISFKHLPPPGEAWLSFTKICLAMAGVEAVANMTGLMHKPVEKTARRTILPVLLEVVLLNMLFGVALAGLPSLAATHGPDAVRYADAVPPAEVLAYRDTAMEVLATESASYWLGVKGGFLVGKAAAIIFGLLLLSAANTAVLATMSILWAMAKDHELPKALTKLNYSGVPWVGLLVAVVTPLAVLLVEDDVVVLAELYVIGVCGAITTNTLSCAVNRRLDFSRWQRLGMTVLGLFLLSVTLTIVVTKPRATIFAGAMIGCVLGIRWGLKLSRGPETLPEPATGWLSEVKGEPLRLDPSRPRIMLAARGRGQAEYAVDLARQRGATLFAMYVRTIRVLDLQANQVPRIEDDPEAQASLGTTALTAKAAGVPFVPIYVTSSDIAEEILDYTVTYGCDTLIMGKSRRTRMARAFAGDVLSRVSGTLPDGVTLITRGENN